MAVEILTNFTPRLSVAFSLSERGVQEISDQCLSEDLITEEAYKSILDSAQHKPPIENFTILLCAVQTRVRRNESCFESVLNVLQKVLGSHESVLDIEREYSKLGTMPQSKRRKMEVSQAVCTTMESEQDELFTDTQVSPEIRVIQCFTPELVSVVSGSILEVSDQFLAEELITEGVYRRILESSMANADKTRILLNAVKDVIRIDNSYFETTMSILKALPICSELIIAIEAKHQKLTLQRSQLKGNCATISSDQTTLRARHFTEIRVIQKFTPQLINGISACLQEVLDKCLAKGLISESKRTQLFEYNIMCSKDKVRMLLQTIKDNIAKDERCFELFLSVLSSEMPHAISRSLLSSIRDEYHKLNSMPSAAPMQPEPEQPQEVKSDKSLEENVLDRLEEAIEKKVQAIAEKKILEEELALKRVENDKLKKKLKAAKAVKVRSREKDEEIMQLKKKLAECETEIDELNDKIQEQEKIIDEYKMNAKREETVAQEKYKKMTDDLRAAIEAKEEMNKKVQQQKNEIGELNEKHQEETGRLQATIARLSGQHCGCSGCVLVKDPPYATVIS